MRYVVMGMPGAPTVPYLRERCTGLVFVEDRGVGVRDTFERAIAALGEGPSVLFEDDIILTLGFHEKLQAEIERTGGTAFINGFSMRKDDERVGSRWLPGKNYLMQQMTYWPAGLAPRYSEWLAGPEAEAVWQKHPGGTDTCTAAFLARNKMEYWQVVPALVDHLTWPSRLGPRSTKRQARIFVEPDLAGHPGGYLPR